MAAQLHASTDRGSRCSPPAAEAGVIRTGHGRGLSRQGDEVIDRRLFLASLTMGALAAPSGAPADERLRRVGYLEPATSANTLPREILPQRLRERGWIEGKNIAFDWLYADAKTERLSPLVGELLRRKVDVIVTSGTTAIRAAKDATTTTPIVMVGGGDPVGSRLVQSLAHPGGNVTGVSLVGQELMEKNLELLKRLLPTLKTVTMIRAANNPANGFFAQPMDAAARRLGVRLTILDIHRSDDLGAAFDRISADAAIMLLDPMFLAHRRRIAALAIRRRLPLMTAERRYAEAGFLLTYGAGFAEVVRLAAAFVDRILRGVKPADLPVEQPSQLDLVLNLATAKALGLSIRPAILVQARQVID
jgi:putative ABC transport system substrate-binding protein